MGLDSYWYIREETYEAASCGSDGEEEEKRILRKYPKAVKAINGKTGGRPDTGAMVLVKKDYKIGYFRKFNAMHGWVVKRCADGVDMCQDIEVSDERIRELLGDCREILLENLRGDREKLVETASRLLPPTEGFFFGGKEIDERYLDCVSELTELLTSAQESLKELREESRKDARPGKWVSWSLIYASSW